MNLIIKLQQKGKKHKRFFQIIVSYTNKKRNSFYLDKIGFFNPYPTKITNIKNLKLNINKLKFWLAKGAKLNKSCQKLLFKIILLNYNSKK